MMRFNVRVCTALWLILMFSIARILLENAVTVQEKGDVWSNNDSRVLRQGVRGESLTYTVEESMQVQLAADHCPYYMDAWNTSWQVHRFTWFSPAAESGQSEDYDDVTLVTQVSVDKLNVLGALLRLWNGPVSVAVYVPLNESWSRQQHTLMSIFTTRKHNVTMHTVQQGKELYYPVNVLRNVAVAGAVSRYVFLVDVDFLPSETTERHLHQYKHRLIHRQVLVVPAFAFTQQHDPSDLVALHNKSTLIAKIREPYATVKNYGSYAYLRGHRSTLYNQWYEENAIYKIEYEFQYEPYVMMLTSDVLRYPEIFLGRYFDKASFFALLALNRYEFYVLPDAYVVHLYHFRPPELLDYYVCSWQVLNKWEELMFKQYGVHIRDFGKQKWKKKQ